MHVAGEERLAAPDDARTDEQAELVDQTRADRLGRERRPCLLYTSDAADE